MRPEYEAGLAAALAEAELGVEEGGMPFGAVLLDAQGQILARGHNRQIQSGRWLAHAETECLGSYLVSLDRKAILDSAVLVATEAPCPMCAGAAIICGIKTVVAGETVHYAGAVGELEAAGVEVLVAQDQDCIDLVSRFKADHQDRWNRFSAG